LHYKELTKKVLKLIEDQERKQKKQEEFNVRISQQLEQKQIEIDTLRAEVAKLKGEC
jgi:L-rhamnose isomerase